MVLYTQKQTIEFLKTNTLYYIFGNNKLPIKRVISQLMLYNDYNNKSNDISNYRYYRRSNKISLNMQSSNLKNYTIYINDINHSIIYNNYFILVFYNNVKIAYQIR